jgi:hypothetical protein
MKSTRASKIVAAAVAPVAAAAILLTAPAPAFAAVSYPIVSVAAASDDALWDDGQPAGGTGIDPGPQTAPDLAGVPEGVDSSELGERAGGTGVDPGIAAPPDTPSGPGLEDGGEPAGAV